jgi:pimeloyl-ACP methyl ester carboxylesterase
LTNNVEDLAELIIKRLNLGPVHLIGHSYGALTALYTTYQHPDLVRSLVLGEPPVMSLLEYNQQYSKDVDTIIENAFKPAQEAIRRGEMERAVSLLISS